MDDLLLFSGGELTAANNDTRILEGYIVKWNVKGNTSAGATVFSPGSIKCADISKVNLVGENINAHDKSKPFGKMISMREDNTGIYASFKISKTSRGDDALIEASDKLRLGFSVGAINAKYERERDYIRVTVSDLDHVAHVGQGAIAGSEITRVAASENAPAANPLPESEAPMTTSPDVSADVTAPPEDAPPAVETSQVEAKVTRPAVPATKVIGVRSPINSTGSYLQHAVNAKTNWDTDSGRASRDYIGQAEGIFAKAFTDDGALSIEAANDSFTTNPAFKPVQFMNEFITNTRNFGRPTIEACGGTKPLPKQGMTFSIPKLTTAPNVALTTEAQAVQGSTGMVTAYITGTKVKYAGTQIISREMIDNGADSPLFYTELMDELNAAYDFATNAAAIAAIIAGGTAATTTQAATLAGLEAYIAESTVNVYDSTSYFARNLVVGKSWWSTLIGALDTTGRPLFNPRPSNMAMNTAGVANPTSVRGDVLGLDMWVDRQMVATALDNSAFVIAPESIGLYESSRTMLSIEVLPTLEYQVALYGYFTPLVKQATGLILYDKT